MLRINHTNDDLGYFFEEIDSEFETLERVIKDALEIIEIYDNEMELSKLR